MILSSNNTDDEFQTKQTPILIKHPFLIYNKEEALLYQANDIIEYHFTDSPLTKSIKSQILKNNKTYLECEIQEDNSIKIINTYNEIFVFQKIADFYIPNEAKSINFYTTLHQNLLDPNIMIFEKYSNELNEYLKINNFPSFEPNELTKSQVYDFSLKNLSKNNFEYLKVYSITITDPIPCSYPCDFKINFVKQFGEEKYSTITKFINININQNILNIRELKDIYKHNSKDFKFYQLKYALTEYFFIYSNGPWRYEWIRFGYDPRVSWENYKYQRIVSISKCLSFIVKENPALISEIEKNRSWYIKTDFDNKMGFLTDAFMKFVNYMQTHKIEEIQYEDEYDLFD